MHSFLEPVAEHKRTLLVLAFIATAAGVYAVFFSPVFSSSAPSVTNVTIAMPTPPPTPGDTSTSSCYSSTEEGPQGGGWGPERPTYGGDALPATNSFNVLRDNPNIGDERAFVGIRDAAAAERVWHNRLEVEPGKTYRARVYVHNGASDAANQVATGVRVMLNLPTCAGHAIALDGFVTSDDAFPRQVYSKVVFGVAEISIWPTWPTAPNTKRTRALEAGSHWSGNQACLPLKGFWLGMTSWTAALRAATSMRAT